MFLRSTLKKLGGATVLLGAMSFGALASGPTTIYPSAPPVMSWTGFYVGSHLGGAWTDNDWSNISLTNERAAFSSSGFAGGLHAGYQVQFGQLVAGVEVGYTWLDASDTVRSVVVPAAVTYGTSVDDLLTIVGRLGVASGPWLFYGRAGYASADVEYRGAQSAIGDSFSRSDRRDGYVVGLGVEHMLTRNLVLGLEYNFVSLDGGTVTGLTQLGIPYTLRADDVEIQSLMARLNWRF